MESHQEAAKPATAKRKSKRGKRGRIPAAGRFELLQFKAPAEWDETIWHMVNDLDEASLARGSVARGNRSDLLRAMFFPGYRDMVQRHSVFWMRKGIPVHEVARRTRLSPLDLRNLAKSNGIPVAPPEPGEERLPALFQTVAALEAREAALKQEIGRLEGYQRGIQAKAIEPAPDTPAAGTLDPKFLV